MAEPQDINRPYQAPPQQAPPTGGPIRTERREPIVEGAALREPYAAREAGYYAGASAAPRVSWGALFAGFFAAIVVQLLLLTLGAAVGLTATGDPATAFGPGMGIWWVITSIIALFVGGWTAARLMNVYSQEAGAMHGFLVWGVTTVLGMVLITTAGLGGLAMGMGVGGTQQFPGVQQQPGIQQPGQFQAVPQQPGQFQQQPGETLAPGAPGVPAAQMQVDPVAAAWWTFVALLLGGAAAIAGGWIGAPATTGTMGRRR